MRGKTVRFIPKTVRFIPKTVRFIPKTVRFIPKTVRFKARTVRFKCRSLHVSKGVTVKARQPRVDSRTCSVILRRMYHPTYGLLQRCMVR